MKTKTLTTWLMLAAMPFALVGCLGDDKDEGTDAPGSIEFRIEGEDITYDSLTGESGYNHVRYATIEYAYMMIKDPKLDPHNTTVKVGVTSHTGTPLSGIYAVNLMQETTLGTVDSAEAGDYGTGHPSINVYNADATERSTLVIDKGGLVGLPAGVSFRFGGMIYPKAGGSYRWEIREIFTGKVDILEYPPEAGEGTALVVKPGKKLEVEFHPHIDHALEVIAQDRLIDFSTLTKTSVGDTILFTSTVNNMVGGVDIYSLIVGHINLGSHWDVNVIPE